MTLPPVSGDIGAAANPYGIMREHVVQKSLKGPKASRAANQPTVEPDRHHLRRYGPFFVERIEGVRQVRQELITRIETL